MADKRDTKRKQQAGSRGPEAPGPRSTTVEGELRGGERISGELLLAVIDRAERHRVIERDLVPYVDIVAHLGVKRTGWMTRRLRAGLEALVADGLLVAGRILQFDGWALSDAGRARLEAGLVGPLPESPQHRAWRRAHAAAAEQIDVLRANARTNAGEVLGLLDSSPPAPSDAWLLLAARLGETCRQLGQATHCLHEWSEPDDARADIDDPHDPGDELLDPALLGLFLTLRQYRRSPASVKLDDAGLRSKLPVRHRPTSS